MAMVVRASKRGYRSMLIDVDSYEEEETMVQLNEKNKAKGTHRSNRLQGCRAKV